MLSSAKYMGKVNQVDEESYLLGMKKVAEMLNDSINYQNLTIASIIRQVEAEIYRSFIPIMEDALKENRIR